MKNKQNLVSKSSLLTLCAVILFSLAVRLFCASERRATTPSEPQRLERSAPYASHTQNSSKV